MSDKAKRNLGTAGIIALCLSNLCYMSDLIMLPGYAAIFGHFKDSPTAVTDFIASGSQLTLIVGSLLAPIFMRYFSKRSIILVGFAIFTIQASCTGLVDSAEYVAVMRGITGFFMGLIMPVALALIIEWYSDDEVKRNKYTGWFDGCLAGMGAVLMILGGILLTTGWQNMFLGYLLGIPIWIMLFFTIPWTAPEGKRDYKAKHEEAKKAGQNVGDGKMNWRTFIMIFLAFSVCNMFYGCLVYKFSIYLAENFMWLPPWVNGVLGAAKGIIGAIMGIFVFAALFKRAGRFTITICFAAQAIAFLGLYFVFPGIGGVLWFLLCYAFIGVAFGLAIPYYHSYGAVVFPPSKMPLVASMISVAFAFGAFVSSYFVTWLQEALNLATYTACLPYIGIGCVAATILTIIIGLADPNRKKLKAQAKMSAEEEAMEKVEEVDSAFE